MQELKSENRNLILDQMLKISPWLGWNDNSIRIACKRLCLDKNYSYIIFPRGIIDILDYYTDLINLNLITEFKSVDSSNLKLKEKIYFAIKIILDQNFHQKLAIKRIVSYYLLPGRYIEGLKTIYKIVDNIWYVAQDQSTDFNFYTKRAALAKIYIDIVMTWINDNSKNNNEILEYSRNKIDNFLKFNPKKLIKKIFNFDNIPFIRLIKNKF